MKQFTPGAFKPRPRLSNYSQGSQIIPWALKSQWSVHVSGHKDETIHSLVFQVTSRVLKSLPGLSDDSLGSQINPLVPKSLPGLKSHLAIREHQRGDETIHFPRFQITARALKSLPGLKSDLTIREYPSKD